MSMSGPWGMSPCCPSARLLQKTVERADTRSAARTTLDVVRPSHAVEKAGMRLVLRGAEVTGSAQRGWGGRRSAGMPPMGKRLSHENRLADVSLTVTSSSARSAMVTIVAGVTTEAGLNTVAGNVTFVGAWRSPGHRDESQYTEHHETSDRGARRQAAEIHTNLHGGMRKGRDLGLAPLASA